LFKDHLPVNGEMKNQRDPEQRHFYPEGRSPIASDRFRRQEQRTAQEHDRETGRGPSPQFFRDARSRAAPDPEAKQTQVHHENGAQQKRQSDQVDALQQRNQWG
jgi:hypothetical protein